MLRPIRLLLCLNDRLRMTEGIERKSLGIRSRDIHMMTTDQDNLAGIRRALDMRLQSMLCMGTTSRSCPRPSGSTSGLQETENEIEEADSRAR